MDRYLRRLKNQKGFTLVELMVVVVIIGVLVAIAIPIFNSVQKNAKQNAHDANVRTLQGSAAQFLAEKSPLAANVTWDGTATAPATDGWKEYLQSWPTNPTNGGNYTVSITTAGVITVLPALKDYGTGW